MTQYRAVTRIKRQPPRNPDRHKPSGIYGTADIGLALGHSPDFFAKLEAMLGQRWGVMAEDEVKNGKRSRAKRSAGFDVIQTGAARNVQKGAFTEVVLRAIEGRKRFTINEIAEELGEDKTRVNHAIHGLRKSKIVVSADGIIKRGKVNYWRHADVTFSPKREVAQTAEAKAKKVRAFMAKVVAATRAEIEEGTGLTKDQILHALSPMKERGEVTCQYEKESRNYVWRIAQ